MKVKNNFLAGSLLLGGILTFAVYGIGQTLASGDYGRYSRSEHDEHEEHSYRGRRMQQLPLYVEECGSCHMAYPAQFLPPASWQRIMAGLEDHFGENAEVDAATRAELEYYLGYSSSQAGYRKLLRNVGNRAPLRITELPYFVHEHDEIPSRFIQGNDKVGSLSQCNACHRNAEQGGFDEDNVNIPGVGRWDD